MGLWLRTLGGNSGSGTASGVTGQADSEVTVSLTLGAGVEFDAALAPWLQGFLLCLFFSFCWGSDSLYWERPSYAVCLHAVHSMVWRHRSCCQCTWPLVSSCRRLCCAYLPMGCFPRTSSPYKRSQEIFGDPPSFILTTCPIQRGYLCLAI